jgi:hypothetical protein
MELREPKEIIVLDDNSTERKFTLSKFPAWDGLEINERYPAHLLTALAVPRACDWEVIKQLQLKILKYVAVDINGRVQRLETIALIDNHVPDSVCLIQLLAEEVKYNNRFFRNGTIWTFLHGALIEALPKIIETFTPYLPPSSPTEKPRSTNSEPSTP